MHRRRDAQRRRRVGSRDGGVFRESLVTACCSTATQSIMPLF